MKKVYIVERHDGTTAANFTTGTRIYTRFINAFKRLSRRSEYTVVEYELVPTGKTWNKDDVE